MNKIPLNENEIPFFPIYSPPVHPVIHVSMFKNYVIKFSYFKIYAKTFPTVLKKGS